MADKIGRSIEAQRILDSEVTQEAFQALEEIYIAAWRNGKDVSVREDAHRYVTLLTKFRQHFRSVVTTGEMEAKAQRDVEGRKGWSFVR